MILKLLGMQNYNQNHLMFINRSDNFESIDQHAVYQHDCAMITQFSSSLPDLLRLL